MRLRKILLEVARDTSHIVTIPRYEVAVRRAVNPPGTKFRIHSRSNAGLTKDDFVDVKDWKEAWADLRGRYSKIINDVFDATTFQDEFEACVERDGVDVVPNPAELVHDKWEPLLEIEGVDETIAQGMFQSGIQSVNAVAAATLDELEAVPGSSTAKAKAIQDAARVLCDYVAVADTQEGVADLVEAAAAATEAVAEATMSDVQSLDDVLAQGEPAVEEAPVEETEDPVLGDPFAVPDDD